MQLRSITRRCSLIGLACAFGISAFHAPALAQEDYPSGPVTILVGFSAGSSTDVASRLLAAQLSEILGERVLVENRPGAASSIATQAVASANADGQTLLMATVANTIGTALGRDVAYDFPGDFAPVALVGAVPMIVTVHPDVKATSMEELIALARAGEPMLLYGSAGVGTAPHLSAELFASSVGAEMTHVPYQGSGDAVRDLAAGRIDLVFAPQSSAASGIEDGSLRGLASTLSQRSAMFPDLPTVSETAVEGFDTSVWFGLVAPAGTPDAIVDALADAVNTALETDAVRDGMASAGIQPLGGSPADMASYIDVEVGNWSDVVEAAGISLN
ncbi:tripartite-type tricarboxylate transporter receptor subunit TctC [Rhodovulum iodosum]|uniref:Tripartite-type tricarboxylate transporter receptor subunit TctC n=1 Tax=Rhodovulum iodosum TaxID=68291 RepID=A0ABV3XWI8_9RHOB|nr:tripartite tricarboxylate transporter substrate-binding protein [Rhodovulum robiginosum]RSK32165.1 tripartite tricarboxylate transporter substrate binding protein [Rhodovulum robiginosum]